MRPFTGVLVSLLALASVPEADAQPVVRDIPYATIVQAFQDLGTHGRLLKRGAEGLGLSLEAHAGNVIRFMREQADVLGLKGTF